MGKLSNHSRAYCQDQVDRRPGAFRIACLFAPAEHLDALLAMEALFCVLGDIPATVSDSSVGMAKLQWWRRELQQQHAGESAHPLVISLQESGAGGYLDNELLDAYLVGLFGDIDPDPVADDADLLARLSAVAAMEVPIMAGVLKSQDAHGPLLKVGAANALLRLLLGTTSSDDLNMAWVPMNVRAMMGATDGNQEKSDDSGAKSELISSLSSMALDWLAAGRKGLECGHPLALDWRINHVYVTLAVHERILQRMTRKPRRFVRSRSSGIVFSDVLIAWRQARRGQQG
jgi:phytoene/squalene synthetase